MPGGSSTVKLVLSGEAGGTSAPGVMGLHRRHGRSVDNNYTKRGRRHGRVQGDRGVEVHSSV